MTTFTPNIPASGQSLGQTRDDVRDNFSTINTTISVDHVAMNAANQGKHKQSNYPVLGSNPTTASGEIALFSQTGSLGSEIFMIREGNASTKTALTTSKITAPVASTNGYSWLPGGVIIQWGQANFVGSNTTVAVTFVIPFPTASFNIQVTMIGFGNAGAAQSNSTTGFTCIRGAGGGSGQAFWWIAIGN